MKNHSSNHAKFFEMFLYELRDIYSAETQIIENMQKLISAATTKELKEAFTTHFEETKKQKLRLDQVFQELGETPSGEFCQGLQGLLKEADEVINKGSGGVVEDAALIAAAQKIEHYEIATYGTLRTWAHHLGLENVEEILQEILDEEGKTNNTLTSIAEGSWLFSGINAEAVK